MSASVSGAYASAHLPECTLPKGWGDCICAALRACEQRSYALGIEVGKHDGWIAGHAAGVQAARDAVAAVDPNAPGGNMDYGVNVQRRALAAIDALAPDPHRAHREDGVQWCEDCTDDTDDRPTPCELHRARGQRWCRDCYADAEAEARGDREREGR